MKKKYSRSIPESYMNWIRYDISKCQNYDPYHYEKLFYTLIGMQFIPYDDMDQNRLSDAKYLKRRFANVRRLDEKRVEASLRDFGDSVLEVMISLSLRLYEETTRGFPTPIFPGEIFWSMIESMHLEDQQDESFDENHVIFIVQRMMVRDIGPNGDGGLFTLSKNSIRDMRKADLWYQAQWWATDIWNRMNAMKDLI